MPDKNVWSGFYKKALRERQNQLALAFPNLFKNSSKEPFPIKGKIHGMYVHGSKILQGLMSN
jgi:hypothetical protein